MQQIQSTIEVKYKYITGEYKYIKENRTPNNDYRRQITQKAKV